MKGKNSSIFITRPSLPKLKEFMPYLEEIWESHVLTNNGKFHQEFETKLVDYLGIKYASIYSNGTLALIAAIKVLELTGEIITTPFSFVATSHAIDICGLKPVFVDIETQRLGIDPDSIKRAITEKTSAIIPVHVYGNPCMMNQIESIAKEYGLRVIYDAAHAFGVKENRISVLNRGDLSILSFHTTKLFSTIEGGAVVCSNQVMKRKLDMYKNFGIVNETKISGVGINAKMNELQAAFGLMQLKHVDGYIEMRRQIVESYKSYLRGVNGISFMEDMQNIRHNYNYFPVFVDAITYGMDRDGLYENLKQNNIFARKYFYPLISNMAVYRELYSANPLNLKTANEISASVLCLPLYSDLDLTQVERVCRIIMGK